MDTNDLLLKLQELEDNLQTINSAKDEVNKTVNAYSKLGVKISSYADRLNEVSKQLKELHETIKETNTSLLNDFERRQSQLSKGFVQSVTQAANVLQSTSTEFKNITDTAKSSLVETIQQTGRDFKEQVNDISQAFFNHCNNAIVSFKNASDAIHNDMERIVNSMNNAIADNKGQISELRQELLNQNKTSRKLSYFTLIFVAVSLILSFCSLIVK